MIATFGNYIAGQGGSDPSPWWLAGDIPASTNYTIYDILDSADLAASYVNLANPGTRNASPVVAPTYFNGAYKAWQFNGTTQYLDTQTLLGNASTVIAWVEDCAGVYLIGSLAQSPTRYIVIRPVSASQTDFIKGTGSGGGFLVGPTRGGILALKDTAAYKNNISAFWATTWTGGTSNRPIYVGCLNSDGTPNNFASGKVLRLAMYDIALTEAQIFAVTQAMYDYDQPAGHAYKATVLSTNPICYWPATQRIGSSLFDVSGNNAHGESYFLPVGAAGNKGLSIAGNGDPNNMVRSTGNWATRTGINLNEFSAAMWMKVNSNPANQIRVFNFYSGNSTEYSALEIRSGLNLGVFCAENGVTEDSGTLVSAVSGQWHHIVHFNSLSAGKFGVYFDGVKYERNKTLTGFVDTSPDPLMPFCGQDLDGNFQHISFYNHMLSQSEVNTLYVP